MTYPQAYVPTRKGGKNGANESRNEKLSTTKGLNLSAILKKWKGGGKTPIWV